VKRLIIDIGNSFVKVAVFDDTEVVFYDKLKDVDKDFLEDVNINHKISSSILSSVREHQSEMESFLKNNFFHITLDNNTKLPFTNKYKTPETLGRDRIAVVAGGLKMFSGNDLLIIDAGTSITFDYVNENKEYSGGAISPGLIMRFKALHTFTGKLPLITNIENVDLIGYDTNTSILSGVVNGTIAEIDGIIHSYQQRFPNLKILITGGDYIYFVKKLKNSIFAAPNLVLQGLNEILRFNEGT
jgi:type III pantothenate kinase